MEPQRFLDTTNVNAEFISSSILEVAQERGVPAITTIDEMKSGGLFGQKNPCVIVSHPKPPQSYFSIVIIINGDTLNFQFWGKSKNTTKINLKEHYANNGKLSGMIKSALIKKDDMSLQTEQNWYADIMNIVESLMN